MLCCVCFNNILLLLLFVFVQVFEQLKRGKRKIRFEKFTLDKLGDIKDDEHDIDLYFDDIVHIPWTGKTDFDACIKEELPEDHIATKAGIGKGDRLIGISGMNVSTLPFNGVLKYLKKACNDKKKHTLRFKNLPDGYWDDLRETKGQDY